MVNGKKVTVTEKTVRKPDGTVETTRTESDGSGAGAGGSMSEDQEEMQKKLYHRESDRI